MRPLCIELFAGTFGWGAGFIAEGFDVIGFDIMDVQQELGIQRTPGCQLVIQDVLTLYGSQLKDAAVIVASPPCQKYSYMAMPWTRGKKMAEEYRSGVRSRSELNALFNMCFILQIEACEAAGLYIPLVVENVRGAQPWVGAAKWNYGSFYLWGDVPALMPTTFKGSKVPGFRFDGNGGSFQTASVEHAGIKGGSVQDETGKWAEGWNVRNARLFREGRKNSSGSWFNVAHNTTSGKGRNPVHALMNAISSAEPGVKFHESGHAWYRKGLGSVSSKSDSRKAASAHIAKIPFPLARHIARVFKPVECEVTV